MAYQNNTNTNNEKKADGFLNLVIKTADGSEVKLRRGIALDLSNKVERSLLNAAEAQGDDFTVSLTGTVHRVEEDDGQDIQF